MIVHDGNDPENRKYGQRAGLVAGLAPRPAYALRTVDEDTPYRAPEDTPTVRVDEAEARELGWPARESHEAAREHAPQLAPGTMLGERYRIVSMLGRGGMGEVYRADDLKLGQSVALKFMRRRAGGSARELVDEVRIGRQISHPNICRLYDIAEVDGQIFITMEFVDGEDLSSLLRRVGRLPPDRAAAILRDLCAGVAAVHEKGALHRDLKPGNVMIDGRGRARITDFGLAVAHASRDEGRSAGTPAYMAPEQLTGEPASEQSDVYALALIGYEVLTGRRPFEAGSAHELLKRQRAFDMPRPSLLVRDVDPAVERAILHALHPDPDQRPASVEELMRELPSNDPLAAAVAAGETPSPAMVAAAGKSGELPLSAAAALLVLALGGLLTVAMLSARAMLFRRLPVLKPAEVLLDRTREILAAAGHNTPPADSSYVYSTIDEQRPREAAVPSPIVFMYRQSPRPMIGRNGDHRVVRHDPPLLFPGMADVTLDAAGRLTELTIVPPRLESAPPRRGATDFSRFFPYAGVDAAMLTEAPPRWSSPVDSDEKRAWTATLAGMPLRFEAAAYHGRPVWFAMIPPWQRPPDAAARPKPIDRISVAAYIFFLIALPVTMLVLMRRNLVRRRVDWRGGLRIAAVIFAASMTAALLRAHHVSSFVDEWMLLSRLTVESTFWALIIWVFYIAIEPLARRRWPEMLISWTRLLAGRAGDAMVGRDVLAGVVTGIAVVILLLLTAIVVPDAEPLSLAPSTLGELRHSGYCLLRGIVEAIGRSLGLIALLLLLRAVVRNERAAAVLAALLLSVALLGDATGPLWDRAAYALLTAALVYAVLFRLGLLAVATAALTVFLLRTIPLTLDPSAWYFGRSSAALLFVAALALYGFVTTTREKMRGLKLAFE